VDKVIGVIAGDPELMEVATPTLSKGNGQSRKSERVVIPMKLGNTSGGKDPYFGCALEEAKVR
jgi:hypothetical protein